MKKTSFILLRASGILVGTLLFATAPFIAYGIKGNVLLAKPSPRLRAFLDLLIIVLFVAMGLHLVTDPDRGAASRIAGCLFLLLGFNSVRVAEATRRSTPGA